MNHDSSALAPVPAGTLDRYGAVSRCLLRLRENNGEAALADGDFLRRYAALFPQWQERPGELDVDGIRLMVEQLGLGGGIALQRNYAQVHRAHQLGHQVLVLTVCAPLQQSQSATVHAHAMLLESITPHEFTVWCPFESGASDTLPPAARAWWDQWRSVAVVISPARAAPLPGAESGRPARRATA